MNALLAVVLLAFPRAIRRAHRDEIEAAFEETLRDAAARGRFAVLGAALRLCAELFVAGLSDRAAALARDVRYGARSLARTPAFTTVVIATFAVAIGVTASVYAIVDAVVLRPLPWPDADRLVFVNQRLSMGGAAMCARCDFAPADLEAWRSTSATVDGVGEFDTGSRVLDGSPPVRVSSAAVDERYFAVLGARPLLGRFFSAADRRPGAPAVAVVSYAEWQSRFGGDPAVVGRRVRLDGVVATVVAVSPRGFADPTPQGLRGNGAAFWVPLPEASRAKAARQVVAAVARVRAGTALAAVRSDVQAMAERARARTGNLLRGTAVVVPVRDRLLGDVRPLVAVAIASIAIALAVACANVCSLLLARASARRREIAVRTALGATGSRIVAQLLTETLALAAAGAALGTALAALVLRGVVLARPGDLPRIDAAQLDVRVMAAVVGATVLAAVVAGVVPAADLLRRDGGDALKRGDRGGSDRRGDRTREGFVAAQIALALAVAVLSGLVVRSVVAFAQADPGFDPRALYAAAGDMPAGVSPGVRLLTLRRLRAAASALPGVEGATVSDSVPFAGFGTQTMTVDGHPPASPLGDVLMVNEVDRDYFATLGMPLREGRAPVARVGVGGEAVVSAQFVRRYYPRGHVLGTRVFEGTGRDAGSTHRIVGVVADVPSVSLADAHAPMVYELGSNAVFTSFTLTVRSALPPAAVRREVETAWRGVLGRDRLPARFEAMSDVLARETSRSRAIGSFLAVLALIAVALAATGVYGVAAFAVARRTRDIGIRMALGSSPTRVLAEVLARGAAVVAIGMAAGVVLAAAIVPSVAPLLFAVSPNDPATYAVAAVVLAIVTLGASSLPARRATKVDPVQALRYE